MCKPEDAKYLQEQKRSQNGNSRVNCLIQPVQLDSILISGMSSDHIQGILRHFTEHQGYLREYTISGSSGIGGLKENKVEEPKQEAAAPVNKNLNQQKKRILP